MSNDKLNGLSLGKYVIVDEEIDSYNDSDWPPKVSKEFTAWNSPSPSTRRDCFNGYFQ